MNSYWMMKQSHSARAALGKRIFDNYMKNNSFEAIDEAIEGQSRIRVAIIKNFKMLFEEFLNMQKLIILNQNIFLNIQRVFLLL